MDLALQHLTIHFSQYEYVVHMILVLITDWVSGLKMTHEMSEEL